MTKLIFKVTCEEGSVEILASLGTNAGSNESEKRLCRLVAEKVGKVLKAADPEGLLVEGEPRKN